MEILIRTVQPAAPQTPQIYSSSLEERMGACLSLGGGGGSSGIEGRRLVGQAGRLGPSSVVSSPPPRPVRAARPESQNALCSKGNGDGTANGRRRGIEQDRGRGR